MIGGDKENTTGFDPIFETLARMERFHPRARSRRGSGRSARRRHDAPLGRRALQKMVHNGIEYGLMQAYAEGRSPASAADSSWYVDHTSLASDYTFMARAAAVADSRGQDDRWR